MRKLISYKRTMLCVFAFFAGVLSASAQSYSSSTVDGLPVRALFVSNGIIYGVEEVHTLFTEGIPVTSTKANLDNLFTNVPRFVKNAADFKMQSFKYVGRAKNHRFIRNRIKESIPSVNDWRIKTEISKKKNDTITQVCISMVRESWRQMMDNNKVASLNKKNAPEYNSRMGKVAKKMDKLMPDLLSCIAEIGDEVWCVRFMYQNVPYVSYVFIDPEDFRVHYAAPWLFALSDELIEWVKYKREIVSDRDK